MRLNKKIIALVLAGAMVVSLAPANVGVVQKASAAYDYENDYNPDYQGQEVIKDANGKKVGKITYTNKAFYNSSLSYDDFDGISYSKVTYYYGDYENETDATTVSAISYSNYVSSFYEAKAEKELGDEGIVDDDSDEYENKLNAKISSDWKDDVAKEKKFTAKFEYFYFDADDKKQEGEVKLTYTVSDSYQQSKEIEPYAIYKYETDDDTSSGPIGSYYLYSKVDDVPGASYISSSRKWYKIDKNGELKELVNYTSSSLHLNNSDVIDPESKEDDEFRCVVTVKYSGIELQTITYDYKVYKVASRELYNYISNDSTVYAKENAKAVLSSGYEAANGSTVKYSWKKYDSTKGVYTDIENQTGKTYTIESCKEADFGKYQVTSSIYVGECLYDTDTDTIELVQNPPYSVNKKEHYNPDTDIDSTGKKYPWYSKYNKVIPGETDKMTVDIKLDEGYTATYTWYELKDGKWDEITTDDAKSNVYSKTFTAEDFDKTTYKSYKCKVTAKNATITYDKSYFVFTEYRDPETYVDYTGLKYGSSYDNDDNVQKVAIGAPATLTGPKVSANSQYQVVYQWQKKTSVTYEEYSNNRYSSNKYFSDYDYDSDTTKYYKWEDIKDATTNTYSIASVTNTAEKCDFGTYRLKYNVYKAGVTDYTAATSIEGGDFYITLDEFCGFKAEPKNTEDTYTLDVDGTIDLGVNASITNTEANNQKYEIAYQWQKYNTTARKYEDIADAKAADYKKEKITEADFGKYQCVVKVVDKTTKVDVSDVEPAIVKFTIKQVEKKANDGLILNSDSSYVLNHKNLGETVTLSVSATTEDATKYPLTYKWEKIEEDAYSDSYGKYVDVIGADGKVVSTADYALSIADETAFTTYRCTVSNGAKEKTVIFKVLKEDNFYAYAAATKDNSKDFVKKAGESVKMQVVTGSDDAAATFTYKWYAHKSNDNNIGSDSQDVRLNGNTDTYEIASITEEDFNVEYYYCEVKNELTKETKTVSFKLSKYDTTDITFTDLYDDDYSDESFIKVELGTAKEFGAIVKNPESKNFIYKWSFEKLHKDDSNRKHDIERSLDCATEKLTLSNITEDNLGIYTLRIFEGSAADDDTPIITHKFNVAKKDAAEKKFELNAVGNGQRYYYRAVGGNVTFGTELSTESTDSVTYQWYKGYVDDYADAIYGETGASLSLTNLRKSDFGTYTCVAKAGDLTDTITFRVTEAEAITVDWNNDRFYIGGDNSEFYKTVRGKIGDSMNLSATVTSATGDAISYQWYEETTEESHYNFYTESNVTKGSYKLMQGQTSDTLSLNQMTKDAFKQYKLIISNGGYTVSVYYTVERTDMPEVVIKADKTSLEKGETAVLTASVTNLGDKTATYQWYKDGVKIEGATAATYTTEALFNDVNELKNPSADVRYSCEVSTDIDTVKDDITLEYAGWGTISSSKNFIMKGDTTDISVTMKEAGDWKYTWYKYDEDNKEYVKMPEATTATITVAGTCPDDKSVVYNKYNVIIEKGSDETYVSYKKYISVKVFNTLDMTKLPSGKVAAVANNDEEDKDYNQYFGYAIEGASKLRMTFDKDSVLYDSGASLTVYELDSQKTRYFDGYDLAGRTYTFDSGKCVFVLSKAYNEYTATTDGFKVAKAINPDVDYSSLSVAKKSVKLSAGKSTTVTYNALDNFGDTTKVSAKTSNKKVATVSVSAGKVTIKAAKSAKGGSTAKITLTNGAKKATISVAINNPVKSVKAAKKSVTVKKKKTVKLTIKITASNKSKKTTDKVTAKTSKKKIAKVTKTTVSKGKAVVSVKGLKKGTSKITVTAGKKKATVTVKVK